MNFTNGQFQPAPTRIISNTCQMFKALMCHRESGFAISAYLMNSNPYLKFSFFQYLLNKICIGIFFSLRIFLFLFIFSFYCTFRCLSCISYHSPQQIIIHVLDQLLHLLRNFFFRNIHCFQICLHIP